MDITKFDDVTLAQIFVEKPKAFCKAIANKWHTHNGVTITKRDLQTILELHETYCTGHCKCNNRFIGIINTTNKDNAATRALQIIRNDLASSFNAEELDSLDAIILASKKKAS